MALEAAFRRLQIRLAERLSRDRNQQLLQESFALLQQAQFDQLEQLPPVQRQQGLQGVEAIERAYSAPNLVALVDLPFALLFVVLLLLLAPPLGGIALIFLLLALVGGLLLRHRLATRLQQLRQQQLVGQALSDSVSHAAETVRLFDQQQTLQQRWQAHLQQWLPLRRQVARLQGGVQGLGQTLQALLSITLYATGALLVVRGHLDMGTLIGANILALRALGPVQRFTALAEVAEQARQAFSTLQQLQQLPLERRGGTQLGELRGELTLHQLMLLPKGATQPLFERIDLTLPPGAVLAVTGSSGSGKSALARLLLALLPPTQGQILVDGVDLRQIDPQWWRQQLMFVPQEPRFLNATLRENLLAVNPNLDDAALLALLTECGLASFVERSSEGLATPIQRQGLTLPLGLRRRLALARALATDGRILLLDDAGSEGDEAGRRLLYQALLRRSQQGCSVVLMSRDPLLLQGAGWILDLDHKPVPQLRQRTIAAVSSGGGDG